MTFALALAAALAFGGAAFRLRLLDGAGAVAGALLAASLVGLGGGAWAVPAFVFFISSSLLSKVGSRQRAALTRRSEKGDRRDAGQVLANGGAAWGLLLLHAVRPAEVLYWGFLGALAAAAADTWATEVGKLSAGQPRHLLSRERVPRGTSGAVSLVGTLGALAGAVLVWGSAWAVADAPSAPVGEPEAALALVGSGLLGAFADSLAGATVQARYRDPRTGAETERPGDEGRPFVLVRGYRWITNDCVNVFCTFTGALAGAACFQTGLFLS